MSKSKKTIRPLYDKLVVKKIKGEDVSKGGIIIPEQAKEKPIQGEVLAVGEGAVNLDGSIRAARVKVGEIVIFGKYAGHEAKIGDEDYLLLREDDILGIVE